MFLIFLSVAIAFGAAPIPLIIDTDLGFNADDVGALAIANHLTDIGAAQLLGVVHNTDFYYGIGGCDVINHYYGRKNNKHFTEGAYKGTGARPPKPSQDTQMAQHKYTQTMQHNFPSPIKNYDHVQSAAEAYETMLSSAADNSVVIASIGQLINLRAILQTSKQLFVQKVRSIYYNFGGPGGYNFGCNHSYMDATARSDCYLTAQYVVEHIPKSIKQVFTLNTLLFDDGGMRNLTAIGARFKHANGCGQGPVKQAYAALQETTSWDMVCVYLAAMGAESLYSALFAGTMTMNASDGYYGSEYFNSSKGARTNNQYQAWIDGRHVGDVAHILDNALCAAPCLGPDAVQIGACGGYQMNAMKHCYEGHGAVDIDMEHDGGSMSLYDCQRLCDEMDGCTGVTVRASDSDKVAGYIDCYCRKDIDLGQCDVNMLYDTYTKMNVRRIKIFVKSTLLQMMTFEVDIYAEILNVKNKIQEQTGQVFPRQHTLIFEGEELKDFLTLSDYNITAESTLHLAFSGVSSFLPYVVGFICCVGSIFVCKYMRK